jgi:stress response protein YsnF
MAKRDPGPRPADLLPVVLPVATESVVVRKRPVVTGMVRLRKTVRERTVHVDQPLLHEDVVIERVPVGRIVGASIPLRREGDTLVLSVMEEVLVKQLRLVEEIRIRVRRSVEHQRRAVRLLREEVHVERRRGAALAPGRANDARRD